MHDGQIILQPRSRKWLACVSCLTLIVGLASQRIAGGQEDLGSLDVAANEIRQPIENGFLFVNGQYVSPPAEFCLRDGIVTVNRVPLDSSSLEVPGEEGGSGDCLDEVGAGEPRIIPWAALSEALDAGCVVFLFSGEPALCLSSGGEGQDLLTMLTDETRRNVAAVAPPDWLPNDIGAHDWRRWFAEFQPTTDFLSRAKLEIDQTKAIDAANQAAIRAVRVFDYAAYPLTIAGMVLVVLSFGHLISHPPAALERLRDEAAFSPELNRLVCRSLLLVGVLSVLDLVWTLLASQAGVMRELNPLGGRLLANPQHLMLFKLSVTALAVGILFCLRRASLAQRAAWWSCLVCTLLAARWLTFSSMFIS